jgi:hypothetical protein
MGKMTSTSTWKTTSNKRWIFNFYFYYKNESREKAEVKRQEAIVYLRGLLERKSYFAVVARDENREQSCLLLRGYMRLRSPCNNLHAKGMVGRYSKVRPPYDIWGCFSFDEIFSRGQRVRCHWRTTGYKRNR